MSKGEDRLVVVDMQPDFTRSSYRLARTANGLTGFGAEVKIIEDATA